MEAPEPSTDAKRDLKQKRKVEFAGADADEDESSRPRETVLTQKKKKSKERGVPGLEELNEVEEGAGGVVKSAADARAAAQRRAEQRKGGGGKGKGKALDATFGSIQEVTRAEEEFQGEEDEKDEIEAFNLDKEREEGYFDADGNYVEYKRDAELHDAWLDSAQVEPRYAAKAAALAEAFAKSEADGEEELSRADMAAIKRRIADTLHPGETVLKALRRLGGKQEASRKQSGSSWRARKKAGQEDNAGKGKNDEAEARLSEGDKKAFEQLTDDAFKLMDGGETDVYSEVRETFLREAEGYEALARARDEAGSTSGHTTGGPDADRKRGRDEESESRADGGGAGRKKRAGSDAEPGMGMVGDEEGERDHSEGPKDPLVTAGEEQRRTEEAEMDEFGEGKKAPLGEGEGREGRTEAGRGKEGGVKEAGLDMFGDDGEEEGGAQVGAVGRRSEAAGEGAEQRRRGGGAENGSTAPHNSSGYEYDPSSGFFYNAELGYYYDSTTALFCSAATAKWYKYNDESNGYDEVEAGHSVEGTEQERGQK